MPPSEIRPDPGRKSRPGQALFVCTHNSARSHLPAALWRSMVGAAAESAGTHPVADGTPGAFDATLEALGDRIGVLLDATNGRS